MPAPGYRAPDRKERSVHIPVDEEMHERLKAAASAEGLNKTAFARRMLNEGLERRGL